MKTELRQHCKHFTGFDPEKSCRAGLPYAAQLPYSFSEPPPCLSMDSKRVCEKAEYPTPEEAAEERRKLIEAANAMTRCFEEWICPTCRAEVFHERQIGRCAYAEPCGHRLYQGQARGKRPANIKP